MELNKKLKDLLNKNKEVVYVSKDDVEALLEDPSDFDDVEAYFEDENVKIYSKEEIDLLKAEDELEEESLDEEEEAVDFPGNAEIEEVELINIESIVASVRTDDPVRMYLKDIGNIPLLGPDEEMELANIVVKGREAQAKIEDFENCLIDLSDKEEAKYRKMVDEALYAKNKLVDSNLD